MEIGFCIILWIGTKESFVVFNIKHTCILNKTLKIKSSCVNYSKHGETDLILIKPVRQNRYISVQFLYKFAIYIL